MKNNPAVAAIQYALDMSDEDGMIFLRMWDEGNFDEIREDFPDAPEEVFIGADPLHPETEIDEYWILVEKRLPENTPGFWSKPVIALSDTGDIFKLSCMGGFWQRTKEFVESGSTKVIKWKEIED